MERKTRLLWAMQEEDLRRRREPEWQAIMREQQEGEEVGSRGPEAAVGADAQDPASDFPEAVAQDVGNTGPATTSQGQVTKDETEMWDQSRDGGQVPENKESATQEHGSGAVAQGSGESETAGAPSGG
jgi:hypothetical protein